MSGPVVAPGHTFGRLRVIERAPDYISPSGYPKAAWHCRCDCGNELVTLAGRLRSGQVQSCGCLLRDWAAGRRKDITGQRFGSLTAVERLPAGAHRTTLWRFRCDCGATVDAQPTNVRRNVSQDCRHRG